MTILAKIVLIGDGAVGKTSLRQRFMGTGFKTNYLPTLGADFVSKSITINGTDMSLQIWDLAGQPTFKQIRKLYYRNAIGAMLVFDITDRQSLLNLKYWAKELITYSKSSKISVVVLGNKCDLTDREWVNELEVNEIIDDLKVNEPIKNEIYYYQTSAKENRNVDNAFISLGKNILKFL
ncbi:MAG: Rab family GTPase [Candidatus Hodarchaeales archaeon]